MRQRRRRDDAAHREVGPLPLQYLFQHGAPGKGGLHRPLVPMDKLDAIVSERIASKLLTHERVGALLAGMIERQSAKDEELAGRLVALRAKVSDVQARIAQLYDAIEKSIADLHDPGLKERIAHLKEDRAIA